MSSFQSFWWLDEKAVLFVSADDRLLVAYIFYPPSNPTSKYEDL